MGCCPRINPLRVERRLAFDTRARRQVERAPNQNADLAIFALERQPPRAFRASASAARKEPSGGLASAYCFLARASFSASM